MVGRFFTHKNTTSNVRSVKGLAAWIPAKPQMRNDSRSRQGTLCFFGFIQFSVIFAMMCLFIPESPVLCERLSCSKTFNDRTRGFNKPYRGGPGGPGIVVLVDLGVVYVVMYVVASHYVYY